MSIPIALQLYSIRDLLAQDFDGGVRKVAEIGYAGVETAGFPGTTPQAAARLFQDLGLAVCGAHIALPLGDKKNEVLDTLAALGCTRLVCPALPREQFQTVDGIRHACETLNAANDVARANGLSLGYHTHWWEMLPVDGRLAYSHMLDHLSPDVFFEIDTYWAQTAGADPVAVVRELGARVPLLHIKDGPARKGEPMTAAGDGVMDFPPIIAAGANSAEWLIFEMDTCATDALEAVARSYRYLAGLGA